MTIYVVVREEGRYEVDEVKVVRAFGSESEALKYRDEQNANRKFPGCDAIGLPPGEEYYVQECEM